MAASYEASTIPQTVLALAEQIFDNREAIYGMPAEARGKVVAFLENAGHFLSSITDTVNVPVNSDISSHMAVHDDDSPPLVTDVIGEDDAHHLHRALETLAEYTREDGFDAFLKSPERKATLDNIKEASAIFRAVASSIRTI